MAKKIPYLVVYVTVPSKIEARRIARDLVGKRLAACVNIIGGVQSVFRWQGKIDQASESLLIIKTSRGKFPEMVSRVTALHSYEVPEIIALPLVDGNVPYLRWMDDSLGQS